jgi:hypothetical protein
LEPNAPAFVLATDNPAQEAVMAKETRKESKGKPKKATTKASAAAQSGTGQIVSNAPASKSGANVKPNPGAKR